MKTRTAQTSSPGGDSSPQLVERLLDAYCPDDSVILDPFTGSGTVLYEAASMSLAAYGYEINPSAWSFSKLYEFANVPPVQQRRADYGTPKQA